MPATATGRGAQVVLDGDAQAAARGAYATTMRGNAAAKVALELAGIYADGSTPDGSTLTGAPPDGNPVSASDVSQIPRARSLIRSWVPNSRNWVAVSGGVLYTLSGQWGLEADFSLVRLVYSSPAAAGYSIVLAKVSPSSAVGDGHSPVNAAGANDFTMFVPVTFNNAGLDVSPQDQATWGSGTATFAVPDNAGSLLQPPRYYSDWVRVLSLPRTDGGVNPLLMTRHLTDNTNTYRCASTGTQNWPPLAQGRTLSAYHRQNVDSVTTPALLAGPTGPLNFLTPDGVQYVAPEVGFTVLSVGDSITQGFGSGTLFHSWGYLSSLALSTPSRPISYWNQGWQGGVSADFIANGYAAFKVARPDVVTIQTWTQNETGTQAAADASWERAIAFADYVMKQGAVPVLMGPPPASNTSAGVTEAARLSVRTRMLQAGAYGMPVLDWEAALGTGGNPNRIQSALIAADAIHPNDAGNAVMDRLVFRPVLARILRA